MNQTSPDHTSSAPAQERRKRPDLRVVFEQVISRLEPFFSHAEGLNGNVAEYWAVRTIHETHPDLTHHDAKVLLDAAVRYFRERALGKRL